MVNKFKNILFFYLKTLGVYGILFAILYCPSMQHEQKYDEHSVDCVAERLGNLLTNAKENSQKAGYPYARMMNLIEQARSLQSQFRVDQVDVEKIGAVKELYEKTQKIHERLLQEKSRFSEFLSQSQRRRGKEEIRYVCKKTKCRYLVSDESSFYTNKAALSRKARRKKTWRYTTQVLNKNINKINFIGRRLKLLIDKSHAEDEAAKARSESLAKELVSNNNQ